VVGVAVVADDVAISSYRAVTWGKRSTHFSDLEFLRLGKRVAGFLLEPERSAICEVKARSARRRRSGR